MKSHWVGALTGLLIVAACAQPADTIRAIDGQGPEPPAGTATISEAVDGLVVGHRLMAAGQYELALKAYHRGALKHGLTADVLSALGSANLRLGRLNQAEDLLRKAVKKDETFVAAWNNLGVVLMERGEIGEARQVFRRAFAMDNGESEQIRENLRLSIAKLDEPTYDDDNNNEFKLVRRGKGRYLLLPTPGERFE